MSNDPKDTPGNANPSDQRDNSSESIGVGDAVPAPDSERSGVDDAITEDMDRPGMEPDAEQIPD